MKNQKKMNRAELIDQVGKFFTIEELVCKHTFGMFGAKKSWMFLDEKWLETLLVLRRDIFKAPITLNNWHKGGKFDERGLRCNLCSIPRGKTKAGQIYLSAHNFGKAGDFDVASVDDKTVREIIQKNESKLPYPIRIEVMQGMTWTHVDVYIPFGSTQKVVIFNV